MNVFTWYLPRPLWLLPDVLSMTYPASFGRYWCRGSALLLYCQHGRTTTAVRSKKLQCVAAQSDSVCIVRHLGECGIHQSYFPSLGNAQQFCSENTPSCLFSCCLTVGRDVKLNHTKSRSLAEPHGMYQILSISFLAWKTHKTACT